MVATTDILDTAIAHPTPESFFGRFPEAWNGASRIVRKVETRQEYREPGDVSWERLADGDLEGALRLVPTSRAVDVPLYESLQRKGVRFMRCRPVSLPLTRYLQWEFACYDFNQEHGEEILLARSQDVADLLQTQVRHDFMVFDQTLGFIHDYDESGEIRGGWEVTAPSDIAALTSLFESIHRKCIPYREFRERYAAA